jgi:DNA-binding transcriptional MerR regulator
MKGAAVLDIARSESTLSHREPVGKTLAEVVVEVGVPPTTIRSWERRYRWPEPTRSRGGHRRYSSDHVRQIVALRDAISRGYSPRVAVPVLRSLEKKRQAHYLQQIGSISGSESGRVMAVLDDARRSLGVRTAVEGVVFPLIRELGDERDAGGQSGITYKGLREWLREQLGDDFDGPLAVLACAPSGDVPLEAAALAVLVASLGWSCRITQTGFSDLEPLVDSEGPEVLVVWCARAADRQEAVRALRRLGRAPTSIFYCGDGFATAQSRRGMAGVYLGAACMEAAERIHLAAASG